MPDSILTRSLALPSGLRVRLRLARPADARGLEQLLRRRDLPANALDVRRMLRFDPSQRAVLCACAPVDGAETLVGVGAIDLRHDAEMDTLVVDERLAGGLPELLADVLERRARSHADRVA
jgi:hypothetical protein